MNRLQIALMVVAAAQMGIALLNLRLVSLLEWEEELERVPLLMKEVFHVHAWFISITLTIFAAVTWRFAGEMATTASPLAAWLAAAIGFFWAVRTVLQVTYYSSSHWRGQVGRTVVHVILLVMYGGFAVVYFMAAI